MKYLMPIALLFCLACDSADNQDHWRIKVRLYSNDGTVISTWVSQGAVLNHNGSYEFRDTNGKYHSISGTVITGE